MKIAILSTPYITVPPIGYGGTELVVANLAEGLVKKGHEVLLFATGDSLSSARLAFYYKNAVGNNAHLKNNSYVIIPHLHHFFKITKKERFDIIHNNCQYEAMFFCDLQETPFIHTLHGAFYQGLESTSGLNEEKREILKQFKNHAFISISNNQRTALPELNYIKTVYNGIKPENFQLGLGHGGYLAYLGRVTPHKGVDVAIQVAKKIGMKIKITAFVDKGDLPYFKEKILPLADDNVEFIGEIKSNDEKSDFLGKAAAVLFPILWHEPFGIVMVESMACGTPVIAFNKGSVPEVLLDKKTGFIVNNQEEMINAVGKINQLNRKDIRDYACEKFNVEKMVDDYILAYQEVIKTNKK